VIFLRRGMEVKIDSIRGALSTMRGIEHKVYTVYERIREARGSLDWGDGASIVNKSSQYAGVAVCDNKVSPSPTDTTAVLMRCGLLAGGTRETIPRVDIILRWRGKEKRIRV
jgi:hypothetical protein